MGQESNSSLQFFGSSVSCRLRSFSKARSGRMKTLRKAQIAWRTGVCLGVKRGEVLFGAADGESVKQFFHRTNSLLSAQT